MFGLKVFGMINISNLKVDSKGCVGLQVELPDCPALLLLITAEKGVVACGFLNLEAAEKLGVAAAIVSGVKTFEDVLNAQIKAMTSKAKDLGVEAGMKGAEALKLMF